MPRKRKLKAKVIRPFRIADKQYKVGDIYTTTNKRTIDILLIKNRIKL